MYSPVPPTTTGRRPRRWMSAIAAARVAPEARRLIAVVGIDDVDEVMRHRRALGGCRLAGGDVHEAVDLAGVGADDLEGHASAQRHRGGGLADPGGARDDEQTATSSAGVDHLPSATRYQLRLSSSRGPRRARRGSPPAGRADRSTGVAVCARSRPGAPSPRARAPCSP